MAISKIILNGVTQMDVTQKTVTSADMLNGVTALKNDGTDITGNIAAMTLPSASSSTSSGTSKATITPGSAAQYLNIPAGYLDTAQYYTIAAASGGASNIVTGTFTGTTTGTAMDVNLSYTGSGYPIVVVAYPSGGPLANPSTFYSLVQRYAAQYIAIVKNNIASTPSYTSSSGAESQAQTYGRYKNSTSNSSSYSGSGNGTTTVYGNYAANSGSFGNILKFTSNTKMSVYIASNYYGFAANIEYKYWVIYSS